MTIPIGVNNRTIPQHMANGPFRGMIKDVGTSNSGSKGFGCDLIVWPDFEGLSSMLSVKYCSPCFKTYTYETARDLTVAWRPAVQFCPTLALFRLQDTFD